ncbi:hypothetical protein V1515DRAFT_534592 [Lipomyces mesembrius]
MTTVTAYLYNARCLGFRIQDITTRECPSPFYRPTTAADDPKALLGAAASLSIPAHLQPTLPQVLFPHHPCFDLLPFHVLRARAITLAAVTPQLFNLFDLKKDIIEDGLIYDRKDNGSKKPWDMRSWEAAPWFLNKWRLLIDGDC